MAYSLQRNGWPVEKVTCFVMNADSLTMLCREGDVEANDNFQRQFSPSCTFSKYRLKIRWFCPQPFFWCTGVFACCERCPCRSPSRGPWLVGVVFGPVLLSWMGVSSAHSLCWYSNDQNHWSRSGTCWQPLELSVEVRNLLGANRFSPCRWMLLYQRARSHVLQLLWNTTSCTRRWEMLESVFLMLPRECFVLYCKTVEHRSRKSRDLLQTGEFTSGDKVTLFVFVVTAFSVVACVLLHACSFVSHPSLHTVKGGIILLDVVSENIPSWHGLCLSCMVIASAAILLLCWLPLLRSEYLIFYCIFIVKLETGDSQDLKYGVYRIRREGEEESSLLPSSSSLPLFVVCVFGREGAGRSGGRGREGTKRGKLLSSEKGQLEAHGWLGERSGRNAWMTSGEIWSGRGTHAHPI